jgi:hypothetical protein
MNPNATIDPIQDDDEAAEFEGRPLFVWLMMAIALVAMAFLLGAAPEASARPARAAAATAVPAMPQAALATSADVVFGG